MDDLQKELAKRLQHDELFRRQVMIRLETELLKGIRGVSDVLVMKLVETAAETAAETIALVLPPSKENHQSFITSLFWLAVYQQALLMLKPEELEPIIREMAQDRERQQDPE